MAKVRKMRKVINIETAADFIKVFTWDDGKYPRNRSLVEITGLIAEVSKTYIFTLQMCRKCEQWTRT